jgi:hypothetical protein
VFSPAPPHADGRPDDEEAMSDTEIDTGVTHPVVLIALARASSNLVNQLLAASVRDVETTTNHSTPRLTALNGGRP